MTSTAWNPRNSSQFGQQGDTKLSSGRTLSKTPSSSRAGRSSSLFSFGSSKKTSSPQITPFTPNIPSSPDSQQASMEQNQNSNDPSPSQHAKRPSLVNDAPSMNPALVIQREIKSVVDLALAHAHKIYYSGPLIRRVERLADGNKPALDEGWVDVWAQLGGTTLSVWDMKAIEEANKRGEEVPPSYINITDCFVQVLGALTSPATPTTPSKRYTNVITLNTAGSNLIFFACPSSAALVAWATSIRLAGWEKSRLEEIYTGHLLRMTLCDNGTWSDPPSTLSKSRLEGFVKARISGHTDWKTFWMSLSLSTEFLSEERAYRSTSPVMSARSKHRVSNLFSRGHQNDTQTTGPAVPVISFYASPKPKDRKRPLLTLRDVTQAYAVYPERPEVIQKSTLIKIEGHLGTEDVAGPMKGRECWIMIMPETQQAFPVLELVKWLIAIHDMYSLYGRPNAYVWDPRQPVSMWFGYPVGNQREHLFISREEAERLDPRDDRTSSIRTQLTQTLIQRMYSSNMPVDQGKSIETVQSQTQLSQQQSGQESASLSPPATAVVDYSQPAQIHQTHSLEARNVSAVRSVSNSSPSQSQATRETTNSTLPLNPPVSTNPRPLDIQFTNSVPPSPSTIGNFISQALLPQPPLSNDNSTQGQSPDREAGVPPSNQGRSPPKTLLREGSATSSNLPHNIDSITSGLRPHPTTLPLHPHPKSPQAVSPPRSPPLPAMPKQVLDPTEIKQPVPGLAAFTSPVAADMNDLVNEPASLFVLRESTTQHNAQKMKEPTDLWSRSDDDEGASGGDPDSTGPENIPPQLISRSAPPNAYKSSSENSAKGDGFNTRVRASVGRKPSGARARPGSGLVRPPEFDTPPSAISFDQMDERSELPYDDTVSTLAAMNFFESHEGFDLPSLSSPPPPKQNVSAAESTSQRLSSPKPSSVASSNDGPQFRSSFALSKQAAERHAKVQAQQEARHQPGKPKTNGGIKPVKKPSDTWAESSEEEEEEEEEDDDDEGSDVEPSAKPALPPKIRQPVPDVRTSVYPSAQPNASKEGIAHSRFLPQPPSNGGLDPNRGINEDRRRPSGDEPRAHIANPHMIARQSVWSSVLDPTPPPKLGSGNKDTFIQVDESETMTKAFQPQGLLSAGIQDKEDRSAKRQEELARETGASLINVPSKPPPPQTGLLGAITAHERERKREGGVGAALTERERERRLAEERQRKLDDLQRQQLDQISQGGMGNPYEMYGQQGFPNIMPTFDPRMSMNPMMLNPFMGFPTMPFGNPQQNMAALMAAQQAYQQAMLSFSQAGSQAGDVPANANAGVAAPLAPQMTGMSGIQPPMMGVDPRMSMVFNPWMMNPGAMGMGMNFPGMANMNMNSSGGLDPRMSGLSVNRPDSAGQGQPASLGTPSPRQNSPAPPRSSNNSPLPPS